MGSWSAEVGVAVGCGGGGNAGRPSGPAAPSSADGRFATGACKPTASQVVRDAGNLEGGLRKAALGGVLVLAAGVRSAAATRGAARADTSCYRPVGMHHARFTQDDKQRNQYDMPRQTVDSQNQPAPGTSLAKC